MTEHAPENGEQGLVPLAELTDVFRRSRATLYRWAAADAIPTVRINGSLFMRRADVEVYTHPNAKLRAEMWSREQAGEPVISDEATLLIVNALREAERAIRAARGVALRGTRRAG